MDKKLKNLQAAEKKFYDLKINNLFLTYAPQPVVAHNNANGSHINAESRQSVSEWESYFTRNKYTSFTKFARSRKHKIYICLIGPFPDYFFENNIILHLKECLKTFTEAFFPGMCIVFMDEKIDHREIKCQTRFHQKSKQKQLFLPDINVFLKNIRPKDAFCICGISWFDFYPDKDLNHILAEASFNNGTVAFSFGHYYKFKEKEAKMKEWENDFVIEPSIEIADSLNKFDRQEEGLTSSSYVYITSNEKEEAKYRTDDFDEHNCMSSVVKPRTLSSPITRRNSPTGPKLQKLSDKVHSLLEKRSPSHSLSSLSESSLQGQAEIHFLTDEKSVISIVSDISMVDVNNKVRHQNSTTLSDCDSEDNLEWDTCQDLQPCQSTASVGREPELDNLLRSALPPGCEFQIDCRLLRRLFRVISHEICHVLGMRHCQYYTCTLNATASILNVDVQPLLLCPICVRKLQIALKFDLMHRYKNLHSFLSLHTHENGSMNSPFSLTENCQLQTDKEIIRSIIDFMLK